MKNNLFKTILSISIIMFFLFLSYGSGTDINDENAVKKDMQGTWVGYSHDGIGEYQYNHYKIEISNNQFKAWIEVGRTSDEPKWNNNPDVTGDWSLSDVLTYTNADSRYRNIYFNADISDNLLKARVLQNCIVYDGGLYVVNWGQMSKK